MFSFETVGSPFKPQIVDDVDASKVTANGPGLDKEVRKNTPQNFKVDASKAGKAPWRLMLFKVEEVR